MNKPSMNTGRTYFAPYLGIVKNRRPVLTCKKIINNRLIETFPCWRKGDTCLLTLLKTLTSFNEKLNQLMF